MTTTSMNVSMMTLPTVNLSMFHSTSAVNTSDVSIRHINDTHDKNVIGRIHGAIVAATIAPTGCGHDRPVYALCPQHKPQVRSKCATSPQHE